MSGIEVFWKAVMDQMDLMLSCSEGSRLVFDSTFRILEKYCPIEIFFLLIEYGTECLRVVKFY